jgi:phospholipase C
MLRYRFRLVSLCMFAATLSVAASGGPAQRAAPGHPSTATMTPVQHLVVIYQENESFDHYFGAYPVATNPPGEPRFVALPNTPAVNGLGPAIIANNPNQDPPFRVGRLEFPSCFENGEYSDEQRAFDRGLLDRFVEVFKYTDAPRARTPLAFCPEDQAGQRYAAMGYVDGNTVTALWNYAQQFAISDNFFGSTFGPSTIGALHLAAADIAGAVCGPANGVYGTIPSCGAEHGPPLESSATPAPTNGQSATLYTDQAPLWDVCSKQDASALVAMSGPNIGDLLNAAGVTWGWFQGGFAVDRDGKCSSAHPLVALDRAQGVDPATDPYMFEDYLAHHEPFQYYASTANPRHRPPSSVGMIGRTDQANHQYDLSDFLQALDAGNLPAVSFLKAAAYQDGHAGYSDPLDEQDFIVSVLNRLQRSPEWASTAVILAWDDSNGYYDHAMPPLVNHSTTLLDDACGAGNDGPPARCGYGPRLPFLVISPFAKRNYVSHALIDQTSIVRFIEDNWLGGQRLTGVSFDNFAGALTDLFDFTAPPAPPLFLDPQSGEPSSTP